MGFCRGVLHELIEQYAPKLLVDLPNKGKGWQVQYIFFARAGFLEAAQRHAADTKMQLVDLEKLEQGLQPVA